MEGEKRRINKLLKRYSCEKYHLIPFIYSLFLSLLSTLVIFSCTFSLVHGACARWIQLTTIKTAERCSNRGFLTTKLAISNLTGRKQYYLCCIHRSIAATIPRLPTMTHLPRAPQFSSDFYPMTNMVSHSTT